MKGFQARAFVGVALGVVTLVAQGQAVMPDAQIESNVLKALAGDGNLATQNIQTTTVYGTVTITGNVHDETTRTEAENLVARAQGVKKVVDELALGDTPPAADNNAPEMANMAPDAGNPPQDANGQNMVLQSDGTYAPAPPDGSSDMNAGQMGQNQAPPPPQGQPYGGQGQAPPDRRPMYAQQGPPQGNDNSPVQGGQVGGMQVVVPAGALVRIRINRGIDSQHIKPGTPFDGTILSDIVAGGAVAIPRGATVSGVVVDAKKTKELSGRGELALQLTAVQLGGQSFPIQTAVWNRTGQDKTTSTVNHAVGLGAVGALFGAVAGGGAGAAIGAGVGAGLGVAGSAGSRRGQIIVPPESVLVFHTAQPSEVKTVSEREMQRLAYSAGPTQPAGPPPGYYRHGYYYPY
jgi:hypothetical protein